MDPSKRFPPREPYQARHSAIPSQRFLTRSEEQATAPSGLCILCKSVADPGVLHPSSARCFHGLSRSHGFLQPGFGLPLDNPSAHNLFITGVHAHLQRRSPASTPQVTRHLPLSWASAVSAFVAFLPSPPKRFGLVSAPANATVSSSAFVPTYIQTSCQVLTVWNQRRPHFYPLFNI